MTRYIQKIAVSGRERWIGWDIDGIGSETPGLFLADGIDEDELRTHGVKKFVPMAFDDFVGLSAITRRKAASELHDQDLGFRLDALLVSLDRMRARGVVELPRLYIETIVGEQRLDDPRIEARFSEWERTGAVELLRSEECYLKLIRRLL